MALMGVTPLPGHILLCDFSRGFVVPEMVKPRPVVVVSRHNPRGARLCTVVPLSTTEPVPTKDWHILLAANPCPYYSHPPAEKVWVKCDMIYSVSFDRLDRVHSKTRKGRQYHLPRLSEEETKRIIEAVHSLIGL